MICKQCKQKIEDGWTVCPHCNMPVSEEGIEEDVSSELGETIQGFSELIEFDIAEALARSEENSGESKASLSEDEDWFGLLPDLDDDLDDDLTLDDMPKTAEDNQDEDAAD